jgi:hypothetical protein
MILQVKENSAYQAVASNTSGTTPKELFEDVIEELVKQVRRTDSVSCVCRTLVEYSFSVAIRFCPKWRDGFIGARAHWLMGGYTLILGKLARHFVHSVQGAYYLAYRLICWRGMY